MSSEVASQAIWHRQGASTLLVMMPGAYMSAQDMMDAGCVDALHACGLSTDLDLCLPALDLSSVTAGSAMPAVADGLLKPARSAYERVWLGGISLGGQLAMWQASQGPEWIDGLCLLAPYPGSRITLNRIQAAGGVDQWVPTTEQLADPEFQVWQWLKQPPESMPVFCGFGQQDRFASGMALVAQRFPNVLRSEVAGGHDWAAWSPLWQTFLNSRLWMKGDGAISPTHD